MADIEALYNSGIKHLSKADKMVAQLAGPAKSEESQTKQSALSKLLGSSSESSEQEQK